MGEWAGAPASWGELISWHAGELIAMHELMYWGAELMGVRVGAS